LGCFFLCAGFAIEKGVLFFLQQLKHRMPIASLSCVFYQSKQPLLLMALEIQDVRGVSIKVRVINPKNMKQQRQQ